MRDWETRTFTSRILAENSTRRGDQWKSRKLRPLLQLRSLSRCWFASRYVASKRPPAPYVQTVGFGRICGVLTRYSRLGAELDACQEKSKLESARNWRTFHLHHARLLGPLCASAVRMRIHIAYAILYSCLGRTSYKSDERLDGDDPPQGRYLPGYRWRARARARGALLAAAADLTRIYMMMRRM